MNAGTRDAKVLQGRAPTLEHLHVICIRKYCLITLSDVQTGGRALQAWQIVRSSADSQPASAGPSLTGTVQLRYVDKLWTDLASYSITLQLHTIIAWVLFLDKNF